MQPELKKALQVGLPTKPFGCHNWNVSVPVDVDHHEVITLDLPVRLDTPSSL